jgi:hypothetical protein
MDKQVPATLIISEKVVCNLIYDLVTHLSNYFFTKFLYIRCQKLCLIKLFLFYR